MLRRLLLVTLAVTCAPALAAAGRVQVLHEDFETNVPDTTSFSGTNGWTAGWSGDTWRSDLNGGVLPNTDVPGPGPFGEDGPADNHLTTGDPAWQNVIAEVTYRSFDDDTVGVIARYQDPKNFYVCFVTRDGEVTDASYLESTQSRAVLQRVRNGVPEDLDRRTDFAVLIAGEVHRLTIAVVDDQVTCLMDDDPNGDESEPDIILQGVDPDPVPSGKAGFWSFDAMQTHVDSWFDDFKVWLNDGDGDTLPDDVEPGLGTHPGMADTDADGIRDDIEVAGNYGTSPTEYDTDGDGLADGTEVYGPNPTDPTVADTDGGGATDGEEDENRNGVRDPGERDPNDASDDDGFPPAEAVPAETDVGGCSCRVVPGSRTRSGGAAALTVALAALVAIRRRRRLAPG